MKTIIKNCVYQSEKPLLTNDECDEFVKYLLEMRGECKDKRFVRLGVDKNITKKWSKRIMSLSFPDWTDKKGRVWTPEDVSPVFHYCHYYKGGGCGRHMDDRYIMEGGESKLVLRNNPSDMEVFSSNNKPSTGTIFRRKMILDTEKYHTLEQFKLLVYLDDLDENKSGGTKIYVTKDGNSTRDCKDYVRTIPRKGHCVLFSLDMWHEGEPIENEEKSFIGFRIRYS